MVINRDFILGFGAGKASGGGGSSIICNTTITIPEDGSSSLEVTLSKTVDKYLVWVCADDETISAILADTTTKYYIPSVFQMYPVILLNNVESRGLNSLIQRFRGSTSSYAVAQYNCVSISGTTMTIAVGTNGAFFPSGTYKVTVWEIP